MTSVVFIQGGGAGARDEDELLVASLRRELGDGIPVLLPAMPDEDDPDEATWGPAIGQALEAAAEPVALVGQSIGGYLLVHRLAAQPPQRHVQSIHLIAAPFPGGDADWTFPGFGLPEGFAARLSAPVFLYASEDDDIVPFADRDLYAAAIPGAKVRTTTGGHQLGDDLSLVAADIVAANVS
jgi:predicted alpha/beta hydrolase family esterase